MRSKAIERQMKYHGERIIEINEGEIVYVRDYRIPNKTRWVKALVIEKLGKQNFICKTLDEKLIWGRHIDQMIEIG